MKLLLVEDEAKLNTFIDRGLTEEGHRVDTAYDGQIGLSMALDGDYDVVILDVNLPILNGFQVCQRLRVEKPNVPVLMLTALGSMTHKKEGYGAGADDYLVKPFEFDELLLRVQALYKRYREVGAHRVLQVADLELNVGTKQVQRAGQLISLTAREYALLEYLMLNKGRIVSRVDIAEKVWELNFDTNTNVIDVYVNYLRRKVDKGFEQKLIHTVVGMGYVMKDPTTR
ncbi:Transcriptional regulatory protein cusR (plasmid) [Fibrella aestuarina BUZ 2]|uniref:Transcriptional regulatory protein cusR n=1 Tax=Fibrella aestuarina BUZ 2 TaxID=1166018 RepID=I0KHM2_9BACT|nr:response regulator transcription factor [Fibrella aestuarina]CCH03625.1 Transcriptional regulatory protein cusR [Fibrella aestuarina BUZ 2]